MQQTQVNRLSSGVVIVLSLIALAMVLSGFFQARQPPQTDEGAAAHIFQLSIAALVPAIFAFFATADWTQPVRIARTLALPAVALIAAFGVLYYIEHVR
jgi:hypothetical protein